MARFTRRIEDFRCVHCEASVLGDGFTNHCPQCLYSRHVDIDPGDRLADCGGLMEPVEIQVFRGRYRLLHRCRRCGFERPNRTASSDLPALLVLARRLAERKKR